MNILIWGIGEIEIEFETYLKDDITVIGYIDSHKEGKEHNGHPVYKPKEIKEKDIHYDFITVASVYSNEIFLSLYEHEFDLEKVIFLRPIQMTELVDSAFRNLDRLRNIAPAYKKIAEREAGYKMGIDSITEAYCNEYPLYQWDYFRYRTFELIADQIKSLPGAVAEAGVFKGFFSKLINNKFIGTKLYLFDSFEGFNEEEAEHEKESGHCDDDFIDTFKDTSVEKVLNTMPNKDDCIIRKGFFPQTANGIEEEFKFVSIDFDFEQSIYDALKWFYPRVISGGYIFVHDYNEPTLLGVKKAVERYEKEQGTLIKIPIADKCGTLIIYKA